MKVPAGVQRALYRVQRSQFHGLLYPVEKVGALAERLQGVRGDYYRAHHICWAYRIFTEGEVLERASDAGEPTGTAGVPILNVLRRGKVINGVLYVARIFGGIKLGRPGLRAAYTRAAELVLEKAPLIPWVAWERLVVRAPLECYGELVQVLKQVEGRLLEDASGEEIYWQVELPANRRERFQLLAQERSRGQVEIKGWAGTTKPRR